MEHTTLEQAQLNALIDRISPILKSRGFSDTSMDLLAQILSMSKRTLYEVFGSKEGMIRAVLCRMHSQLNEKFAEIARRSDNTMEMIVNIFLYHQKVMSTINVRFFQDMDSKYKDLKKDFDKGFDTWKQPLLKVIERGLDEGVFRKDADYELVVRLLRIQLESLKRMEEFFPPDISIKKASDAIVLGMLRSIASPSGMTVLDRYTDRFL